MVPIVQAVQVVQIVHGPAPNRKKPHQLGLARYSLKDRYHHPHPNKPGFPFHGNDEIERTAKPLTLNVKL